MDALSCSGIRRRARRRCKSVGAAAATWAGMLLTPAVATAIGPSDQVIADPPDSARLGATGILSGPGGASNNSGTGTVIGAKLSDGVGLVTVLTAAHVGTKLQNLRLGSGLGSPQSYSLGFTGVAFRAYTITDPTNNPDKLSEDVGVVLDTINLTGNAQAAAAFQGLMNNLPTVTNPANNGNPLVLANPGALNVKYTQVGYGVSGQYQAKVVDPNLFNRGPGYQDDGTFGKRGFQNNTALSYAAPAVVKGTSSTSYEPLVTAQVLDQGNAGGGGGFPGDSGSPWYTGGAAGAVTITRNNVAQVIPIGQTDSISAVFVAGSPAQFVNQANDQLQNIDPLTILVGSSQYAVPIDQGLYRFLTPYIADPASIPEPGSVGPVLGALLALWAPRRRDRRQCHADRSGGGV